MNNYKIINLSKWKRRVHYQVFRDCLEPSYCITFELDITEFIKKVKNKYSFTFSFIYAVSKCANEIEEFRYRFLNGDVVLFDRIDTAFTFLDKETELFKVVNVKMTDTLDEYAVLARETALSQKEYFTAPLGIDIFQFSSLPWISYTHISHTISGKKENATPLFDWGKYFERNGRIILPFSVQAHHSFVDGIHMGRLADKLQNFLNSYNN